MRVDQGEDDVLQKVHVSRGVVVRQAILHVGLGSGSGLGVRFRVMGWEKG